jgi:hypothetical protein
VAVRLPYAHVSESVVKFYGHIIMNILDIQAKNLDTTRFAIAIKSLSQY